MEKDTKIIIKTLEIALWSSCACIHMCIDTHKYSFTPAHIHMQIHIAWICSYIAIHKGIRIQCKSTMSIKLIKFYLMVLCNYLGLLT